MKVESDEAPVKKPKEKQKSTCVDILFTMFFYLARKGKLSHSLATKDDWTAKTAAPD